MFTGLVEATAPVVQTEGQTLRRLLIAVPWPKHEILLGESIAIDGCCLTVVQITDAGLWFEAATETLQRTTLGSLHPGMQVNLERSLRFGDRLGGHLVTGHVDGVGEIEAIDIRGGAWYVGTIAPVEILPLLAPRGSITMSGVSLTVTKVVGKVFWVQLIPHTLQVTTLKSWVVGQPINLEADMIARYVARLMHADLTTLYHADTGA